MIIKKGGFRVNTELMSTWAQDERSIKFYGSGYSYGSVTFTLTFKDADVAEFFMGEIDNAIDTGCRLLDLDEYTKPKAFTVKYKGIVNDYVSDDAETAANKFMLEFNIQVGDGLTVEYANGIKKMYKIERSAKLMEGKHEC